MQNKGAINLFAILLGLACIFYLSFTWVTRGVESDAKAFADSYVKLLPVQKAAKEFASGDANKEKAFIDSVFTAKESSYLDSMKNQPVYNIGLTEYTYEQAKGKEINLGLDLRGGINVTLELSVGDIIKGLSNNNPDPAFNNAVTETQKNFQELKEYNQELQWINKLLHEHQNSSCNKKCSRQTLTSDDDSVQ
jgi:SecD/SecF fusion protein